MQRRHAYATLLLLTSQLVPAAALAQSTAAPTPSTAGPAEQDTAQQQDTQPPVEVSAPGFDGQVPEEIVVTGRFIPNVVRATPQVVSVLSSDDIARTGEGDIAGALSRVTGLSVVGGGFVYVRGLGDRYSSSLLNGSPLPSPEPLRRSVPLDIFPTTIVGSALVQKTYSVNYPAEFGGGVINLTTKAIPKKDFLTVGGSLAADDATTSELGYTYYGGKQDWLGFDDGTRSVPDFIRNAPSGSGIIPAEQVLQLSNASTTLLQRNDQLPANWSAEISGGGALDFGSDQLGLVASVGYSNTWRTRLITQQDSVNAQGDLRNDYRTLLTDNRVVGNALLGIGYAFGENTIRLTNVYIRDVLKQARGSAAEVYNNASGLRFQQNTNWFQRELFETQAVGEFRPLDGVKLDLRGAYANSKRNAPYERQFDYLCSNRTTTGQTITYDGGNGATGFQCDGAYQVTQRFSPFASIIFSDLNENLWTGQGDLIYTLPNAIPLTLSTGYYYSDTTRFSRRLQFNYQTSVGGGTAPGYPYNLLRPDYLLSPDVVNNACPQVGTGACTIQLQFNTPLGAYAYDAGLRIHAGYLQAETSAIDGLRAVGGVRYEKARQFVTPIGTTGTRLNNDYWLPALTLTWNFAPDMQLRGSYAKTISRPQFRELAPQQFRDPDSDRLFFGNPLLRDSKLDNLEARYEWFFARDQRFTLAGFYKRILNPIEQVGFYTGADDRLQTGFTNLPKATLYGGEVEVQKYIPLDGLKGAFFATRRLTAIANYTYTHSEITADDSCVPNVLNQTIGSCSAGFGPAALQFRDGAPLTGQSDHLVNLQLSLEDTSRLSQLTFLFNYASDRVTNRGPSNLSGSGFQPDVIERPGIRFDIVARQGFEIAGAAFELKLEGRNLTRTRFSESQTFDSGKIVYANRYIQGRTLSIGLSTTF
ncbi:hypothetical protein S2M10_20200 [Sphingomonas sp. S2M10]|uniref:TonB-dependent receptor domain-containing protein n=1 Tax=Sphingomonas sp. S2M10 TaxID=2705010 RepID=UPI001456C2F4|nr:TonB-dependent receptor [Sphingomonas sp. S2M10]NLS27028.1 hypothetical protein [Sphingomonas sp. S2M10]